jgi:hypothetical protein
MLTEREMEDLLWRCPEKFFDEPLIAFERQPTIRVGRADLVFIDASGALLVMELKRGILKRRVIAQLLDYESHFRMRYPDRRIRMMAVAHKIFPERQEALKRLGFEWREISEATFVRVAQECGCQLAPSQPDLVEALAHPALPKAQRVPVEIPFGRSREYAIGPRGAVAHLPPTPDREARLNPFAPGSFMFQVFEVARTGITTSQIAAIALKHGKGGVRFALDNLQKGVRRRKGVRDLTGKYGLVWDVHVDGVALPINSTLGILGPSGTISVGNVRTAMSE